MENIVVGICGASGVVLGRKTVQKLTELEIRVHVVVSQAATVTMCEELGGPLSFDHPLVHWYREGQMEAPIASGSFATKGMIVVPCSMATLASIRIGLADTLLRRAADVTIKEGRRLVLVPRETPLSAIHLENMLFLARLGVRIVPPIPAWYLHHQTIDEMEDQMVGSIMDQMGMGSGRLGWKPRNKGT